MGEGTELQAFRVPRKQLCRQSAYFREVLDNEGARSLVLSGEDPLVFGLFCSWLRNQEPPVKYVPNQFSDEPWRSLAAQAWVLGQHVEADHFVNYAFCQFVLNCALADVKTWQFIEAQSEEGSTLQRFSNHWIAWNFSLAQTEYASLKAASFANQVSKDTRDPRTYQADHWNLNCSDDIGSACEHNVGARKIANQKLKRKYSEKGRDWELGQRKDSNDSSSNSPTRPAPTAPPRRTRSPPVRRPTTRTPHRPPPSPVRSVSPRPTSSHSSEQLANPRHQKWIVVSIALFVCSIPADTLQIVCTILAFINLGLSASLPPFAFSDYSIRISIVAYSIFVSCWAAILCLLHWMVRCCGYRLVLWLKLLDALYCVFSFAAAIGTAVDASHCNKGSDWTMPCHLMGTLSAFTWFSLCAFLALTFSVVFCI